MYFYPEYKPWSSGRQILKSIQDYPVYSIGIVAELLEINTETIRTWEKTGVIRPPQRRSGKRFYSEKELQRLRFVRNLSREGLSVRAMIYYLQQYPCWKTINCLGCLHSSNQVVTPKSCWQEDGTFCQVANIRNPCLDCHLEAQEEKREAKVTEPEKTRVRSVFNE